MGWLISAIMFLSLLVLISITQPSAEANDMAAKIFMLIITVLLFAKYWDFKKEGPAKRKAAKEMKEQAAFEKAALIPGTPERAQKLEATAHCRGKLMAGLPAPEGAEFFLYLCDDKVIFERNETNYQLLFEKIADVDIKTDIEIQNSYISSIGGAVGGAVLFGPLGAMVGGRAKKKTDKKISEYLIFAYTKDDATDFISFDVTNDREAPMFVDYFKKLPREKKSVVL
ncbi:MAG TPA: hypothetical protein VN441_01810 [Syntrophomonas sp.]|nr:hypothetical protein [Syntrophomonas sp.]